MKLFPAIDVLDNNAVRLLYGDRNAVSVYGKPMDFARKWKDAGAEYLHLVDLNGAFDDSKVNASVISEIVRNIGIPVQIGGGIKTLERIEYYLDEIGAARVIVGTMAVTTPEVMREACARYGEKIACGIDVKDGLVAIKGWVEKSRITAAELCRQVAEMGVKKIIFTDVSRDGALSGVNAEATEKLQKESGLDVIASGGVSGIEDIRKLKGKVYGAILGRALYSGALDLKTAVEEAR